MPGARTISSDMYLSELLTSSQLDPKVRQLASDLVDQSAPLLGSAEAIASLKSTSANIAPLFLQDRFFSENATPKSLGWQERAHQVYKQAITLSATLEVMAGEDPALNNQDYLASGEPLILEHCIA